MCLGQKLRYSIKVKSRYSELFALKRNDFLCLSVNFKEFIDKFLKESLKFYLDYNNERKKRIEDYKSLEGKIKNKKKNN